MADMVALLLNQPGTPVPASIGRQALCSAAEAGSIPTMQLLITSVPGISEPGIGYNPLTSAAAGGHIPALQFLLQQGAHPKNQHGTPFSYTPHLFSSASATCPLTAAVTSNRSVELIQFLLAQDVHWGGLSKALEEAAAAGNVQVVQLLLSNDANSDPYCYALYAAAKNKHTAVMRTLLQTGTGVSPKRVNSAFSGSAEVGDVEGLALLHQHGAEVNCTDGSTWHPKAPIQHASENNHAAAVQWLLDHGATTELSHLLEALQCGAADAAKQLVRHGVRDDCNTALLAAARRGFTDVVNLLLDAHLPEAHQEAARATVARLDVALCAASSFGRAAVVRSLLERLPAAFPPAASQLAGTSEEAAAAAAAASGLISGADCSTDEESSDGDPEQWDEPWPLWSAEDMENFDSGITEAEAQHRGSSPTPKQTGSRHRLLHRAMEAAAAGADYCPDHSHLGTFKQRVMECSKDKCLWRSAGLNDNLERHLGSNFAETIRLLVAAGVDPTYDDCRFLKRAAERDNCDMIDALLPLCAEHPAVVSGAVLLRAIKNGCLSAMYKLQSHSKPNRSMCHAMEKVMSEQIMGGLYKAMLMKWHTEAPSN
jgi:ankyrin repeat protein